MWLLEAQLHFYTGAILEHIYILFPVLVCVCLGFVRSIAFVIIYKEQIGLQNHKKTLSQKAAAQLC